MVGRIFGGRKDFDEGFATGFHYGAEIAYGTIRMVLANGKRPPDEGGHTDACECRPCELIREILRARSDS